MGAGVSNWELARAVSRTGQLGVVSGTALAAILARRLQTGDPGGQMRHALEKFPVPGVAEKILADYFIPGGKPVDAPFKLSPMPGLQPSPNFVALTVAANFVEVFLAKENHDGLVGINFLEKIQFPTLHSIFGAMLAGVDYVLMGAGIPRSIPGVIDQLARGETAKLKIDIEGGLPGEEFHCHVRPGGFLRRRRAGVEAPGFSRHRRLGNAGDDARAQIQRTGQRLCRRGRNRRRPQRPAARRAAIERARANPFTARATLLTWKKSANWDCRSGWPVPTAPPASSPKR